MSAPHNDIATNRKARHQYHILEEIECGIELRGTEVKAIRSGHVNISDAFARADATGVTLYGMDIPPYENASFEQHPNKRPRRLLLHRKEINKLIGATAEKGATLVALRLHWKKHLVKLTLGVAKGKSGRDKRQDLKARDAKRDAQRAMAHFNQAQQGKKKIP
jgi:SsrA-binding protein